MGLRIFLHSIDLVFRQLAGALRISGLLYLLSMVVSIIGAIFFMPTVVPGQPPSFPWQMVPIAVATMGIYLWIAVSWHRFVLLDELPKAPLPPLKGERLLAYFGRFLQLTLVCMIAGAIFGVASVPVITVLAQGAQIVIMALPALLLTMLLVLSYRLAPMFPGAAIGQPIGFKASWSATSGAWGTLVVLAIVSGLAAILIDVPAALLQNVPAGAAFAFIWLSVTGWVKLMVGISILTTLYGVYVEKRVIA